MIILYRSIYPKSPFFPQANMEIVIVRKRGGYYLGSGFRISKEFININNALHGGT